MKVEKRNTFLGVELHPVAIAQVSKNPKPGSMVRLIGRNYRKSPLFSGHLGCYSAFRTNSDYNDDDDDDNERKLAHPNISAFGATTLAYFLRGSDPRRPRPSG